MASEGTDRRPLTEAYNCSLKILNLPVEVDSLDVHFGAGIVAVSTAYTRLAMVCTLYCNDQLRCASLGLYSKPSWVEYGTLQLLYRMRNSIKEA